MNSKQEDEVASSTLMGEQSQLPFGQRPFISFQTWEELMSAVATSFEKKGLPTTTEEWLLNSFGNFVSSKGSPEEQAHWHSILASKPTVHASTKQNRTAKFSSIRLQPQIAKPAPEPAQSQFSQEIPTQIDASSIPTPHAQPAPQQAKAAEPLQPLETPTTVNVNGMADVDYSAPFCKEVSIAYRIPEQLKDEPSASVPKRLVSLKKRARETESPKKEEKEVKKRKIASAEQTTSDGDSIETQTNIKSLQQEKEELAIERLKLQEENETERKKIQDEKASLEQQRRELKKDQIKWELEKTLLMGMRAERESWLKEKEASGRLLKDEKAKWAEEKERLIAFLGEEMVKCRLEQEVALKAMREEVEEIGKEKELLLSSIHREKLQLLQTLQERKRQLAALEAFID